MPPHVTLKQLRYFDAVARIGHFGKAAEQCAVTQPALSMQIQELERELGAQLVERDRRGVILTDAGREVAARAARILEDTRDLVGFARRQDSVLSGPLHLGVIPSVAPYLLPSLLPLLPDAEAPTVMRIDGEERLALQALCHGALTWQRLEELKRAGARGLMVLPVEGLLA